MEHQRSKIPFGDFRWIGPYLVEKVLPNKTILSENSIQTKLKSCTESASESIILQNLLKTYIRKPIGRYWSFVDDNIVIPQDNLYTIACEAEFGGHLFDIPIIYIDPNAIDFDESCTQGPDTVIVPRSYFHNSSDGQNQETCPICDPTVLQLSKSKSNGQTQDIETTTDPTENDGSKQTSEPNTDTETACEPTPQSAFRQSDTPSTLEINDPTTENIPQNESSHFRAGKNNLRPNPNPNYSDFYRY